MAYFTIYNLLCIEVYMYIRAHLRKEFGICQPTWVERSWRESKYQQSKSLWERSHHCTHSYTSMIIIVQVVRHWPGMRYSSPPITAHQSGAGWLYIVAQFHQPSSVSIQSLNLSTTTYRKQL